MRIETLAVGPLQVNCFILFDDETKQAVVIDPGDEGERILARVEQSGCELKAVINTHGHFDHIGANAFLVEATGAELMVHGDDLPVMEQAETHAGIYGLSVAPSPAPTRILAEDDEVVIGSIRLKVLHTPGHSPGGICLYGGDDLFSGDALFAGSVGRTDLPGGSHEQLISAIRSKLLPLPEQTVVHPGHGPETTIGREKMVNPFLS